MCQLVAELRLFDAWDFAGRSFRAINLATLLFDLAVFALIMLEFVQVCSVVGTGARLMVRTGDRVGGGVLAAMEAVSPWTSTIPGLEMAGLGFGISSALRAQITVDLVPDARSGLGLRYRESAPTRGVSRGPRPTRNVRLLDILFADLFVVAIAWFDFYVHDRLFTEDYDDAGAARPPGGDGTEGRPLAEWTYDRDHPVALLPPRRRPPPRHRPVRGHRLRR